ncbi:MAG: hypothetical protein WAQ57_00410 [Candidatus Saccharimonadales bacterium]
MNQEQKPTLYQRQIKVLDDIKVHGRSRTHGETDIQRRRREALERAQAARQADAGRSDRAAAHSREGQSKTKRLRRAGTALGLTALAIAGGLSSSEDAPAKDVPTVTTVVEAGKGDSYWRLQKAEGASGRDIREVVSDTKELPANDRDNDGAADEIHPGMQVTILDDPNTPPQP